ncbi:MAG: ferritin-like domain-containing protein [Betaproteobacteria bacterium]|nr:ferritin-like domain-containing protein [Betaproteobacteria bacterium]
MSVSLLETAALAALMCCEPAAKCAATLRLADDWRAGRLRRAADKEFAPQRIATPGRPAKPELVPPDAVPRRSPFTPVGHAALLHSIVHIEFNAINLALDCVLRFPAMPDAFVDDWLRVAAEEVHHFDLLAARLADLGYAYGDFPAHNGLWEMAVKTDADVLARMALVPRVLEARGLDATPPIVAKLKTAGDLQTVAVLDVVLRDEVGHVAIGDKWFRYVCAQRGIAPEAEYLRLIELFDAPMPRPPLNCEARLAAGFSEAELAYFETAGGHRSRNRVSS